MTALHEAEGRGPRKGRASANLLEGGTTPSVGQLICCRRHCALPVHVMLRPRGGDFLYNAAELEVIEADLRALRMIRGRFDQSEHHDHQVATIKDYTRGLSRGSLRVSAMKGSLRCSRR